MAKEAATMKQRTIRVKDLAALLAEVAGEHRVFAPVAGPDGVALRRVDDTTVVETDYQNLPLSPKGLFFPQTETLYGYDYDTIEQVPDPEDRIVVFGSRPCDARALVLLDDIFSTRNKNYNDPYYMKRRESSVVISLVCAEPCSSCFCSSVGGGPADPTGSDLLVYPVGEGADAELLFEAHSDRGEAFLDRYDSRFPDSDAQAAVAAKRVADEALQSMTDLNIDKEGLKAALDEAFDSPRWNDLTRNCIGCGACTYLCPTCHCFDISDEQRLYKGKRIRTWDSCQYPSFTAHASGHNPRNTKLQRLRQRFMHKFSYTVENNGEIYCVGCGRCIVHCPVNLDIREVVGAFSGETVER